MGAIGKLGTEWKEFGAGTAAQNLGWVGLFEKV